MDSLEFVNAMHEAQGIFETDNYPTWLKLGFYFARDAGRFWKSWPTPTMAYCIDVVQIDPWGFVYHSYIQLDQGCWIPNTRFKRCVSLHTLEYELRAGYLFYKPEIKDIL